MPPYRHVPTPEPTLPVSPSAFQNVRRRSSRSTPSWASRPRCWRRPWTESTTLPPRPAGTLLSCLPALAWPAACLRGWLPWLACLALAWLPGCLPWWPGCLPGWLPACRGPAPCCLWSLGRPVFLRCCTLGLPTPSPDVVPRPAPAPALLCVRSETDTDGVVFRFVPDPRQVEAALEVSRAGAVPAALPPMPSTAPHAVPSNRATPACRLPARPLRSPHPAPPRSPPPPPPPLSPAVPPRGRARLGLPGRAPLPGGGADDQGRQGALHAALLQARPAVCLPAACCLCAAPAACQLRVLTVLRQLCASCVPASRCLRLSVRPRGGSQRGASREHHRIGCPDCRRLGEPACPLLPMPARLQQRGPGCRPGRGLLRQGDRGAGRHAGQGGARAGGAAGG